MSWALSRGAAFTALVLTSCQQHASAVRGKVQPLQPKGQLVAHPVGS